MLRLPVFYPVGFASVRSHSLVRSDDERVLSSKTIWNCQDCQACQANCPNEIDFGAIAYALRQEAHKRGIAPPAEEP